MEGWPRRSAALQKIREGEGKERLQTTGCRLQEFVNVNVKVNGGGRDEDKDED